MTEPLTIKDLNCENHCNHLCISDVKDSCPNEEICGVHGCTITPEIKSWVEIHGCPNHPLALQVLAKPVIEILEYLDYPPTILKSIKVKNMIKLLKGEN